MAYHRNKGWAGPCEASTGVDSRFGQPLIIKCNLPGKWFNDGGAFGVVLCDRHEDHAERFFEQWRNIARMQEQARLARQQAKLAS